MDRGFSIYGIIQYKIKITYEGLLDATNFVHTIQKRQAIMIACLEEIALNNGWIDRDRVRKLAKPLLKSHYGEYLMKLVKGR